MLDQSAAVRPASVRFEHAPSGFGLGTGTPRLSWQVPAAPQRYAQTAYEVELTDADTGEVTVAAAR